MLNDKKFQPDTPLLLCIFLIALLIFISGVQIGIKHGRELQLDDMRIKYDYNFTDQKYPYIKKFSLLGGWNVYRNANVFLSPLI